MPLVSQREEAKALWLTMWRNNNAMAFSVDVTNSGGGGDDVVDDDVREDSIM